MEDPQNIPEPSQQFENIDFNSSPEENNKVDSNNDDQEQVNYISHIVCWFLFFFFVEFADIEQFGQQWFSSL